MATSAVAFFGPGVTGQTEVGGVTALEAWNLSDMSVFIPAGWGLSEAKDGFYSLTIDDDLTASVLFRLYQVSDPSIEAWGTLEPVVSVDAGAIGAAVLAADNSVSVTGTLGGDIRRVKEGTYFTERGMSAALLSCEGWLCPTGISATFDVPLGDGNEIALMRWEPRFLIAQDTENPNAGNNAIGYITGDSINGNYWQEQSQTERNLPANSILLIAISGGQIPEGNLTITLTNPQVGPTTIGPIKIAAMNAGDSMLAIRTVDYSATPLPPGIESGGGGGATVQDMIDGGIALEATSQQILSGQGGGGGTGSPEGSFWTEAGTPTTKHFSCVATTGSTPVLVVRQGTTGYVRDNSDGTFKAQAQATTPYLAFTEDANLPGFFTASISSEVWSDDVYIAICYTSSALTGQPLQVKSKEVRGDRAADQPAGSETLHEYALVSLASIKSELNIPLNEPDEDDRLVRAINAMTDFYESECNRRLMRRAAVIVEYQSGGVDSPDVNQVWPREWPFAKSDIVSIHDDTQLLYGSNTLIPSTSYEVEGGGRYIKLLSTGANNTFNEGDRNIRIEYNGGFTSAGEFKVPADLVAVAITRAVRFYLAEKQAISGSEEVSMGGVTKRVEPAALTDTEKAVLDKYRRGFNEIPPRHAWVR